MSHHPKPSRARAKTVLQIEAEAIRRLIPRLNAAFDRAVGLLLGCKGRVVVTGMGKAGIIGQKLSATLASTGTPSHWVHPAEATHGDLGRITKEDVVIALSNSGETEELTRLLEDVQAIHAALRRPLDSSQASEASRGARSKFRSTNVRRRRVSLRRGGAP